MSLLVCDHCDRPVDSDADPEAIIEIPEFVLRHYRLEWIICEPCRDRARERAVEDAA